MRRFVGIPILGVLSISCVCSCKKSGSNTSMYTDRQYGFTINAPRLPMAEPGSQVLAVAMGGPPREQFASNVNVIVGLVSTSRGEYRDQTLKRLQASGLALHSERNLTVSGKEAILFDYEGRMGTRAFRFLELVVFDNNRYYSITSTALRNRFSQDEPALRACLDSFRLAK